VTIHTVFFYLYLIFSKPKTKRGKRFLQNREPKVIENVKQAMFIKGGRTSEIVTKSLKQFVTLNCFFLITINQVSNPLLFKVYAEKTVLVDAFKVFRLVIFHFIESNHILFFKSRRNILRPFDDQNPLVTQTFLSSRIYIKNYSYLN
jgi:hypothetical protein